MQFRLSEIRPASGLTLANRPRNKANPSSPAAVNIAHSFGSGISILVQFKDAIGLIHPAHRKGIEQAILSKDKTFGEVLRRIST